MQENLTPQQQKANKLTIMPGIGCLNRRLYIEKYLAQLPHLPLEPCLMCDKREICKKSMVTFT